jgi:hypothetical protein
MPRLPSTLPQAAPQGETALVGWWDAGCAAGFTGTKFEELTVEIQRRTPSPAARLRHLAIRLRSFGGRERVGHPPFQDVCLAYILDTSAFGPVPRAIAGTNGTCQSRWANLESRP